MGYHCCFCFACLALWVAMDAGGDLLLCGRILVGGWLALSTERRGGNTVGEGAIAGRRRGHHCWEKERELL